MDRDYYYRTEAAARQTAVEKELATQQGYDRLAIGQGAAPR